MGWQSYLALYTSKDELKVILDAINNYQKIWFGEIITDEEIGEDIQGICFARVTNVRKLKDKYAVLFGIGGGRGYCAQFFGRRGIFLNCFESDLLKCLENKELWLKYEAKTENSNFKYFDEEFINKLDELEYSNLFTMEERKNALKFIKRHKIYWSEEVKNLCDEELTEIIRETIKEKEEEKATKRQETIDKKLNAK